MLKKCLDHVSSYQGIMDKIVMCGYSIEGLRKISMF